MDKFLTNVLLASDKDATENMLKMDQEIMKLSQNLYTLKEERRSTLTNLLDNQLIVLRRKYPIVYPVYWSYAYGYQDYNRYELVHVSPTREGAEDFVDKILKKNYDDIDGKSDMEITSSWYKAIFQAETELARLKKEWEALVVQDKRSPEYLKILDVQRELAAAHKGSKDHKKYREKRYKNYTDFIGEKFNDEVDRGYHHFFSKNKPLKSSDVKDKVMINVEVVDPELLIPLKSLKKYRRWTTYDKDKESHDSDLSDSTDVCEVSEE